MKAGKMAKAAGKTSLFLEFYAKVWHSRSLFKRVTDNRYSLIGDTLS